MKDKKTAEKVMQSLKDMNSDFRALKGISRTNAVRAHERIDKLESIVGNLINMLNRIENES